MGLDPNLHSSRCCLQYDISQLVLRPRMQMNLRLLYKHNLSGLCGTQRYEQRKHLRNPQSDIGKIDQVMRSSLRRRRKAADSNLDLCVVYLARPDFP